MKVLLCHDIANRWAISLERVYELAMQDITFPKPYVVLPLEGVSLYLENDIIEYEKKHAELMRVCFRGRNLRRFYNH
ncbi:hypothetical protein QUF99_07615 [Bacillus sp. DX4.1]|uniref:hypothetical protein n=1 Tax=Bacillus sp. DX4.1 TaxID=3055867 RepID=UPI0025A1A05D|nr:hypothetical protein [Bacillus sp. DX4.1]MDM5187197.1 hypothetical protein [Bacillus sp. DX4.1]